MSQLCSFVSVLSYIGSILLAIVVLLLMILIHELGHYTAGKMLKFKINEFSIGFGKAIFSRTNKAGEKISLRIVPLGGYCAFEGEGIDDKNNPNAFNNQKPWKRLIVLFFGPFFNLLSGILFSFIFLTCFGYADVVEIVSVNPKADTSVTQQIQVGDVITKVNGVKCNFVYDNYFSSLVADIEGNKDFVITVKRDGKEIDLTVSKTLDNVLISKVQTGSDLIVGDKIISVNGVEIDATNTYESLINSASGIVTLGIERGEEKLSYTVATDSFAVENSKQLGVVTTPYKYGFFEGLWQAIPFTFGWAIKVLIILFSLFMGKVALNNVGGPIATISVMATVTQASFANIFLLLPLIAANLAVFNLLPFPALDGAHMLFVFIEWIRGKPINRKVEAYIHAAGLFILFAFVILVDILYFIL